MEQAAVAQEYERAARYRDLISTVEQLQERQRIAAAEGDDADVFGYHYENGMLAVNLFHMRGGKMVDRREFFWEDLPEFSSSMETEAATDHVGADALADPERSRKVRPGEKSSPAQLAGDRNGSSDACRPEQSEGSMHSAGVEQCIDPSASKPRSPQAALHRPALRTEKSLCPDRFRRPAGIGRLALRAIVRCPLSTRAYHSATTWGQTFVDRSGRQQREAIL
jgi:hypothetical protein